MHWLVAFLSKSLKTEAIFYKFVCTYVQPIQPDVKWRKITKQGKGIPVFCMITPSDIAYGCAIIKNGRICGIKQRGA